MLGALRSSAKTWVAKILLLLLVASFAVWGISGQITSGVGANTVLTAGGTTVSVDDYRLAYNRGLQQLRSQFGAQLTREQASLFGLDNRVLSQLAAGAVLDEQARTMKLGLTKEGLAQVIAEDAQNWGGGANFNREMLRQVLRQVGLTEEQYVTSLEDVAIRQQLVQATVEGLQAPNVLKAALFKHQGESRDVSFLRIAASALPEIETPDDATLEAYFNDNSAQYRAPEYRQIRYVRLTAEEIADPSTIADSTVRAEYEATKANYGTPETRVIQQVVFPDRTAAEQERQRILAGESFEAMIEGLGRTEADVTLGDLAKDALPDPAIAEAAFALQGTDDVSPVIDGAFGPVLLRVTSITPQSVQPFEEVEEQLRQELALVEANDVLLNVHDSYEDARAGGNTMAEAAAAQRLEMVTIDAIDRQGRLQDGTQYQGLPELNDLLTQAFQADILEETPPISAGRSGFLWYEVVDVIADRDRTFDEARDAVTADYIAAQQASQLDDEANRIAALMEDIADLQALADENGYPLEQKFGLNRTSNDGDFDADAIAAVFGVGPDGVAVASTANNQGRLVFKVTAINAPLGDAGSLSEGVARTVDGNVADDLLDQMIGRAQNEITVTVNQAAITFAQQSN